MAKDNENSSEKIKIKEIKEEDLEESELEKELGGEQPPEIDFDEFTEFLQQPLEISSSSPVLEKIASTASDGTMFFVQEGDEEKEKTKDLGPKYLENPEETTNSAKYNSPDQDAKYAQAETIPNQQQRVDLMELGRNPSEIINQKVHFRQSSELKGIESASRENYVAPKSQEIRDLGKRNWLERKEEERVKYKSGI